MSYSYDEGYDEGDFDEGEGDFYDEGDVSDDHIEDQAVEWLELLRHNPDICDTSNPGRL